MAVRRPAGHEPALRREPGACDWRWHTTTTKMSRTRERAGQQPVRLPPAPQFFRVGNSVFDIRNDSDPTTNLFALASKYHLPMPLPPTKFCWGLIRCRLRRCGQERRASRSRRSVANRGGHSARVKGYQAKSALVTLRSSRRGLARVDRLSLLAARRGNRRVHGFGFSLRRHGWPRATTWWPTTVCESFVDAPALSEFESDRRPNVHRRYGSDRFEYTFLGGVNMRRSIITMALAVLVSGSVPAQTQRSGGGEAQKIMQQVPAARRRTYELAGQVAQMQQDLDAAKTFPRRDEKGTRRAEDPDGRRGGLRSHRQFGQALRRSRVWSNRSSA